MDASAFDQRKLRSGHLRGGRARAPSRSIGLLMDPKTDAIDPPATGAGLGSNAALREPQTWCDLGDGGDLDEGCSRVSCATSMPNLKNVKINRDQKVAHSVLNPISIWGSSWRERVALLGSRPRGGTYPEGVYAGQVGPVLVGAAARASGRAEVACHADI